jgi:LPS O-antigen subunit length determinant protein (WzzB/FepE family)
LIIGVNWRNPQEAADLVNKLIRFIDRQTTSEIVTETREALAVRIKNLNAYIEHKRKIATENTRDKITVLEEEAAIARSLGIEFPIASMGNNNVIYITPPPQFFHDPAKNSNREIEPPPHQRLLPLYQPDPTAYRRETQILSTSIPPLYARGWRALEVEAKHLRNRTNNDPYVIGLRELQQELAWISQLEINEESIHVLRMDEKAIPPLHPMVNRLWFTSMGIVLGLVIGVFLTLLIYVARVRNQPPAPS